MKPHQNVFFWIDDLVRRGDPADAFSRMAERFRQTKQYRELFDLRLMQKRFELALPLVSPQAIADVPADLQPAYQEGYVQAAREVGELLLDDGNIARAWPYFRAIGDSHPVSRALESLHLPSVETPDAQERLNSAIQIAFQEGVNPRKGFELILQHYGLCRAITMFSAYPQREGREESLRLVLRTLHREIVENMKRAIIEVEGTAPETDSIAALIDARPWLFDNNAQYTDSSHLASALRFSTGVEDADTLNLAIEIADYGRHLGPMFQYVEDPPFEQVYEGHAIYLRALRGEDVERAIAHFQQKAEDAQASHYGIHAAEVLVQLLVRVNRPAGAIDAFRRYLAEVPADDLACPSLPQLCQMAGDFEQLKQIAAEQSDPLTYLAALIQSTPARPSGSGLEAPDRKSGVGSP